MLISSPLRAEPASDSFSSTSLAEICGETGAVDVRSLSPSLLASDSS